MNQIQGKRDTCLTPENKVNQSIVKQIMYERVNIDKSVLGDLDQSQSDVNQEKINLDREIRKILE